MKNEIIIKSNSVACEVITESSRSLDITLERGSKLNLLLLHTAGGSESEQDSEIATSIKASVLQDATLNITTIDLGEAAKVERNIEVELNGRGANYQIGGVFIAKKEESIQINSTVRHNVEAANSDQNFRGIATDSAKGVFKGLIYVKTDANQTVALQNSHNILLSDTATIQSDPQLEIYADDVKCNHGATVGKRDEQAMFYMRQRGIEPKDVQALLLESFCYSALTGVQEFDEDAQQRVREALESSIATL